MRIQNTTIYIAFDGTEFNNELDCQNYESENSVYQQLGQLWDNSDWVDFMDEYDFTYLDKEDFISFLVEKRKEIIRILSEI